MSLKPYKLGSLKDKIEAQEKLAKGVKVEPKAKKPKVKGRK